MRVAAVQYKADKGDLEGSRAALSTLARVAAEGTDLVVLPEMAATGYVFPDREAVAAVAEPARGPTYAALAPIAREAGAFIICGFPEQDGARLYNSALVIDPAGELAWVYRKTLLYDEDLHWATPGDSGYRAFECAGARFTVGICMDLNDDRFVAWCRAESPRVLAFPTNWVAEGTPVWPYWAWRLDGSGIGLVAANTWGREEEVAFYGRSAVIDGRTVLAAAPEEGNGVIRAHLPAGSSPA